MDSLIGSSQASREACATLSLSYRDTRALKWLVQDPHSRRRENKAETKSPVHPPRSNPWALRWLWNLASLRDPAFSPPRISPPSPWLTLPAGEPAAQGHSHQSLALLLDSLLHCPPLRQPLPPQTHHSPAAPSPGPASSSLSPGPLSCSPVAPAEEDTGKEGEYPL